MGIEKAFGHWPLAVRFSLLAFSLWLPSAAIALAKAASFWLLASGSISFAVGFNQRYKEHPKRSFRGLSPVHLNKK
jgi:hypothetical protein